MAISYLAISCNVVASISEEDYHVNTVVSPANYLLCKWNNVWHLCSVECILQQNNPVINIWHSYNWGEAIMSIRLLTPSLLSLLTVTTLTYFWASSHLKQSIQSSFRVVIVGWNVNAEKCFLYTCSEQCLHTCNIHGNTIMVNPVNSNSELCSIVL